MLRQPVRVEPYDLGAIGFSWKVPQLIEQADMAYGRQTIHLCVWCWHLKATDPNSR